MNVVKIVAEKVYLPVAMYYLRAMAFVEFDNYEEKTIEYTTDGSHDILCVYDEYHEKIIGILPEKKFADCNGIEDAKFRKLLSILRKAVEIVDSN